jgi:hypothetical protein
VLRMFGRAKEAVLQATNRGQEPWIYGSPGGDAVALVPAKAGTAEVKPDVVAPLAVPPSQSSPSEAAQNWSLVKDSTDIRDLEAYRRQYGAAYPFFDRQAERRMEELKAKQFAEAARKADEEVRAKAEAERQRIALLQEEQRRKAAEVEAARRPTKVPDAVTGGRFAMTASARINGGSIGHLKDTTRGVCESRCRSNALCVGFEHNDALMACNLFEIVTGLVEDRSGWVAGTTRQQAPVKAAEAKQHIAPDRPPVVDLGTSRGGYHLKRNNRVNGGALGVFAKIGSVDECERRCVSARRCVAYEFNQSLRACNIFEIVSRLDVETGWVAGTR